MVFQTIQEHGFKKTMFYMFSNVIDLEGNGPVGTQLGGTGHRSFKSKFF